MSRSYVLGPRDYDYIRETSLVEPEILAELRAETADMPMGGMQISPEAGQFMGMLVQLIGASRCIEVGTFTGYSACAVALALPADGRLLCCDVSEEYTAVARRYWDRAGVADKITLKLAPAAETLGGLLDAGEAGQYDLAFIDADKENYDRYYELCLELVRPGGAILVDNVLWGGSAADPEATGAMTDAIKAINAKIGRDPRVTACMLALGDGLTVCRKTP